MLPLNCASILAGLVVYRLLNWCLHKTVKRLNPDFYAELELDRHRKLAPYFVFPLGILLTLATTPVCLAAYSETPLVTDTFGLDRPFSTNGKICLSSRAVLWVSEMPLLSYSSEYVAHHMLSLGSLALVLVAKSPRRPIYLIYAGLVTELFSDAVALFRFHGRGPVNSSRFRKTMLANILSMVLLRIIPILAYAATMPTTRAYYATGIAFYCSYLGRLTFLQLGTLGYHTMKVGRTARSSRQSANPTSPSRLSSSDASFFRRPMTLVVCVAIVIACMSLREVEYLGALPDEPAVASSSRNST
ncbi:hypothetical protein CTA2_4613 [Colletotrichum tanaceti]|uniref:TLC domain-containing protein n=1 Tax=Colletotrichum tanaceti TaxID=1306861 RepID=A0A4U6XSB6_9PEZI|nr:hypothetical protein CTA2_4613 [Colletotrichum tanaceti]TKW58711.1 hypothetical protein CTA1_3155 [Colletotrichum tanaceti]